MVKMTQARAAREMCIECAGSCIEASSCQEKGCSLYPFKTGRRPKGCQPMKLIRRFCLSCAGGDRTYIRGCDDSKCNLWFYKMGRNPTIDELVEVFGTNFGTFTNRMGRTFGIDKFRKIYRNAIRSDLNGIEIQKYG